MLLFRYTKIGLAMRGHRRGSTGGAERGHQGHHRLCRLHGSSPVWCGGSSAASCWAAYPALTWSWANVGLKAFAVVLLGGVDSVGGAILAGIILGMLENVARRVPGPPAAGRRAGPGVSIFCHDHRAGFQTEWPLRPEQNREDFSKWRRAPGSFTKIMPKIWPSSTPG